MGGQTELVEMWSKSYSVAPEVVATGMGVTAMTMTPTNGFRSPDSQYQNCTNCTQRLIRRRHMRRPAKVNSGSAGTMRV